jgi:uncharacterized protein (DUF302 family)
VTIAVMSPYEYTDTDATAEAVVERLRAALRSRGITEYAVVDHGRDMAAAGVAAHPAWTLVFGSPAAGEAVLAHRLEAAVDIPLRLAVVGRDGGSRIVLRPLDTLIGDGPVAEKLTGVLRALAAEAAGAYRLSSSARRSARRGS